MTHELKRHYIVPEPTINLAVLSILSLFSLIWNLFLLGVGNDSSIATRSSTLFSDSIDNGFDNSVDSHADGTIDK